MAVRKKKDKGKTAEENAEENVTAPSGEGRPIGYNLAQNPVKLHAALNKSLDREGLMPAKIGRIRKRLAELEEKHPELVKHASQFQ